MTASFSNSPDRNTRLLLQAGLLIFVYTIAVGILNGLNLVDFDRTVLLSHLHGGTLGWLTLGIIAVTIHFFSADEPARPREQRFLTVSCYLTVLSVAGYTATFATTTGVLRPVFGTLTFALLVAFDAWAMNRARTITLSVPHLFGLVGLTTSVLGGFFGVALGAAIAFGWSWLPLGFYEAHPSTMDVGFVVPVAMGLAEWGLRHGDLTAPASRAGRAQVGVMFAAFLVILVAALWEIQGLVGLGTLIAVIGLGIFFVRMWPLAIGVSLTERRPERHALLGGLLLGAAIVYITVAINLAGGDFEAMPRGRAIAFIHMMAVGGTTNALLAFVIHLSRTTTSPGRIDDAIFAGINFGIIGFVVALTAGSSALIATFVPFMGLALLLAVAVHVPALQPTSAPAIQYAPAEESIADPPPTI